jgi:hypothetical protein
VLAAVAAAIEESLVRRVRYTVKAHLGGLFLLLLYSSFGTAAVLPEDRVDVLYHSYDGGGATINGPSVLVRKGIGQSFSVYGNYYIDMVTSATIDVLVLGASEYEEKRTEFSIGGDYLRDKTVMSFSYTNSSENDYEAETYGFGISQDFFGDLTNISLGITFGHDEVRRNLAPAPGEEPFADTADHRRFSVGISQILTKNFLLSMSFESVIDEGYLNNPYRNYRYLNNLNQVAFREEYYPRTHNSDAFAIRGLYYLPYRASIRAEFRRFGDSWDIQATSGELRYVHPIEEWGLTLEGKLRAYSQTQAEFYNDLFLTEDIADPPIEFRARDKEMSEFSTSTFGFGATYELEPGTIPFVERSSVNFYWDHIQFDYANFRDATFTSATVPPGTEPLYQFNANIIRLFFSAWY